MRRLGDAPSCLHGGCGDRSRAAGHPALICSDSKLARSRSAGYHAVFTLLGVPDMDHRPPATTSGAVPHFYGRDEELAWLCGLLDEVDRTRVPRLAVIIADSGIGKSALVQALYRKVTTDPRWDGTSPAGFWPDAFQKSDHDPEVDKKKVNLNVNPDFPRDHQPGQPPKFMWLGMRWPDPDDRNPGQPTLPVARCSRCAGPTRQGGWGDVWTS